jgi:hypothetical protein
LNLYDKASSANRVPQFGSFLSNVNGVAESTSFGVGSGQHIQGGRLACSQ